MSQNVVYVRAQYIPPRLTDAHSTFHLSPINVGAIDFAWLTGCGASGYGLNKFLNGTGPKPHGQIVECCVSVRR